MKFHLLPLVLWEFIALWFVFQLLPRDKEDPR